MKTYRYKVRFKYNTNNNGGCKAYETEVIYHKKIYSFTEDYGNDGKANSGILTKAANNLGLELHRVEAISNRNKLDGGWYNLTYLGEVVENKPTTNTKPTNTPSVSKPIVERKDSYTPPQYATQDQKDRGVTVIFSSGRDNGRKKIYDGEEKFVIFDKDDEYIVRIIYENSTVNYRINEYTNIPDIGRLEMMVYNWIGEKYSTKEPKKITDLIAFYWFKQNHPGTKQTFKEWLVDKEKEENTFMYKLKKFFK